MVPRLGLVPHQARHGERRGAAGGPLDLGDLAHLGEEVAVEPDPDKQHAAFAKILDIWAEELPYIGLLGNIPGPVIVKNGFRGYLPNYPLDDVTSDEHLLQTESYYWENPEEHMLDM